MYPRYLIFLLVLITLSCGKQMRDKNADYQASNGKEYFQEQLMLAKNDDGQLWGIPLYGPLLFVDGMTRKMYANEADSQNLLRFDNAIYTGILPDTIPIANTAVPFGGKYWTMIGLPLPKDSNSRRVLMMHESFHRIQPKLGFDFSKIDFYSCNHLNQMNGRIYLKLELEALSRAMGEESEKQKLQHIENAILFRLYRHQLYRENAASENAMELLEGIAEYSGIMLSRMSRADIKDYCKNRLKRFYESESFVRSFAYHTIPAYGYLMCSNNIHWNKEINIYTNLTNYIIDFYSIEIPQNLEGVIDVIKYDYEFNKIVEVEEKREEQNLEQIEEFRIKFFERPVLKFYSARLNYAIDPQNVIPMEPEGTVLSDVLVTAEWGALNIGESHVYISKENDFGIVPAPIEFNKQVVKGEGWKLNLNEGWHIVKKRCDYQVEKMKD